ncbi:MAG: helix-turn-helix transcriptional regulator [Planctomycetota bacterium]|nr:helix-turn-helix transcriptional regulator [Planctomycetota bacterium]MDA1250353.1 helix-turn-helix transcriptional regulator [Planctomycetota bacterium]
MIRTEAEYRNTKKQLEGFELRFEEKIKELKKLKLTSKQIERAAAPDRAFYDQLKAEVETYENLTAGNSAAFAALVAALTAAGSVGAILIAARIYRNLKQSDLAERLGVDPSQVSRDERTEYQGATADRLAAIAKALGGQLTIQYDEERELEIV